MLLDARGHLKLTDLGLCKKVGDVSPAEEPEVVLKMLREHGLSDDGAEWRATQTLQAASSATESRHRPSTDSMAMSIDEGPAKRDGQTRREVS